MQIFIDASKSHRIAGTAAFEAQSNTVSYERCAPP